MKNGRLILVIVLGAAWVFFFGMLCGTILEASISGQLGVGPVAFRGKPIEVSWTEDADSDLSNNIHIQLSQGQGGYRYAKLEAAHATDQLMIETPGNAAMYVERATVTAIKGE